MDDLRQAEADPREAGLRAPPEVAALGISVRCGMDGAELVFQTHVAQDTNKAALDTLTDRLMAVAERQRAKLALVELRKNKLVNTAQLENLREDRARIDNEVQSAHANSNRRGEFKRTPQQEQHRAQSEVTEKRLLEVIGRFDKEIADAEALIGAGQ